MVVVVQNTLAVEEGTLVSLWILPDPFAVSENALIGDNLGLLETTAPVDLFSPHYGEDFLLLLGETWGQDIVLLVAGAYPALLIGHYGLVGKGEYSLLVLLLGGRVGQLGSFQSTLHPYLLRDASQVGDKEGKLPDVVQRHDECFTLAARAGELVVLLEKLLQAACPLCLFGNLEGHPVAAVRFFIQDEAHVGVREDLVVNHIPRLGELTRLAFQDAFAVGQVASVDIIYAALCIAAAVGSLFVQP
ncbi:hypothetical protein ES703_120278 [subsurface metagenome]